MSYDDNDCYVYGYGYDHDAMKLGRFTGGVEIFRFYESYRAWGITGQFNCRTWFDFSSLKNPGLGSGGCVFKFSLFLSISSSSNLFHCLLLLTFSFLLSFSLRLCNMFYSVA